MREEPLFLGVDVGTQGVRVVLIDRAGKVWGSKEQVFPLTALSREEQDPEGWWAACVDCLKALIPVVKGDLDVRNIAAISVTSTSGTVIPLDEQNRPLHLALMYSDPRPAAEGRWCREIAEKFNPDGYTGFNASSGLSKMVWFANHFPEACERLKTWIHAADFIVGKLSGHFGTTDYTNALKSGFDLSTFVWPGYIFEHLSLKKGWFQDVVPSGTVIGHLLPELAEELGLPILKVTAGMTDGCASQVASGAVNPGDWNTTIGTTMVIKGVTLQELKDPEGRLYSHRHPEGYWMPGGASNTGADWVTEGFSDALNEMTRAAEVLIPTDYLAYPLRQKGERFPFVAPEASGFSPDGVSREQLFTANMEGVAYLERYTYELIESLSGEKVNAVYTAGGGSLSEVWLRIRASVLGKPVFKCGHVTGAVGAAIVAASQTHFGSLREAANTMTHVETTVMPEEELVTAYEAGYSEFLRVMRYKGYIA